MTIDTGQQAFWQMTHFNIDLLPEVCIWAQANFAENSSNFPTLVSLLLSHKCVLFYDEGHRLLLLAFHSEIWLCGVEDQLISGPFYRCQIVFLFPPLPTLSTQRGAEVIQGCNLFSSQGTYNKSYVSHSS